MGECLAGIVAKDGYDVWFSGKISYSMNVDFLEALTKAIKELK